MHGRNQLLTTSSIASVARTCRRRLPLLLIVVGATAGASAATHTDPFTLVVAPDADGTAAGSLYLDAYDGYEHEQGAFTTVSFSLTRGATLRATPHTAAGASRTICASYGGSSGKQRRRHGNIWWRGKAIFSSSPSSPRRS